MAITITAVTGGEMGRPVGREAGWPAKPTDTAVLPLLPELLQGSGTQMYITCTVVGRPFSGTAPQAQGIRLHVVASCIAGGRLHALLHVLRAHQSSQASSSSKTDDWAPHETPGMHAALTCVAFVRLVR